MHVIKRAVNNIEFRAFNRTRDNCCINCSILLDRVYLFKDQQEMETDIL